MKRSIVVCASLVIGNILLTGALVLVVMGVIPLPFAILIDNNGSSLGDRDPLLINQRRSVNNSEQENIQIYNNRNQGVVNITTEGLSYNLFLDPVPQRGTTGSGSIIDERGYVLTNNHVVEDAAQVFVTLSDGQRYSGEVIGADAENDIAIVRFMPRKDAPITVIPFGSSSDLQVGLKVLAIGNPFGLDRTLTTGVISGLNRPVRVSHNLVVSNMIQTDASINPGNSGGPLLDTAGNLIGINTAIFSPSGGSIGIGFAVPVDTARRVVPELIANGAVRRGWIDIVPRQLFPQLVQYGGLAVNRGILISTLSPNSNAAAAGLRGGSQDRAVRYGRTIIYLGGDVIVGIGEYEITDIASLYTALEGTKPGERVLVRYVREGGRGGGQETEVTLVERPRQYQWE